MNTNLDINAEIERLNKLCASKSIDNNTLLADMKKIKKNKDVTTIISMDLILFKMLSF